MEKIICAIINANTSQQHSIMSLDGCTAADTWLTNTRVQIIPFKKPGSRRAFFWSLYNALSDMQPDLLMTYNWGATDAIWLGRLAGISHIVHHEHGFSVDESISPLWHRDFIRSVVYRLVSRIIVVSHELEAMLRNRLRISEARITRISNGIDTSLYSPNVVERQRTRASLGYEPSDLVIGFCGRLDPVKNLDLLLDILAQSNPGDYPFRLLIVGDGPDRMRLEQRCHLAGLHPHVKFVGQKTEVLPYLRAMDAFLLTSLREQMPLTVLEAMAVGIPVIATPVGEIPYVIDDGVDGFIRDRDALIQTFVQLLRSFLCGSQRKRMADAARDKALKKFNRDRMLQDYASLIATFE